MPGISYTWNEAPDQGWCRRPEHHGWEVIAWPTSLVGDCYVMAICRDPETARLLTNALNNEQIPGQLDLSAAS